jgi:diacylglycerol kinase (ATP)
MRICLYWNQHAGDGESLHHITGLIERAGHQVANVIDDGEACPASGPDVDCVVAAGGDGTVARVARALAGTDVPIAILPLGTANNIAHSLGIRPDPDEAITAWRRQEVVKIDAGLLSDEHGGTLFVEAAGVGLVPSGITHGRGAARLAGADAAAKVEWARRMFLETLSDLRPRHSTLNIDGEDLAGDYLLVEVLNIASVGPRLRLSEEAHHADGLFSVVVAAESDREAIARHLRRPSGEEPSHAWLKSWRARRVVVTGWPEYHVDDQVRTSASGRVTLDIRPACVAVLA